MMMIMMMMPPLFLISHLHTYSIWNLSTSPFHQQGILGAHLLDCTDNRVEAGLGTSSLWCRKQDIAPPLLTLWGTSQGILSKEPGASQETFSVGAICLTPAYGLLEENPGLQNAVSSFIRRVCFFKKRNELEWRESAVFPSDSVKQIT